MAMTVEEVVNDLGARVNTLELARVDNDDHHRQFVKEIKDLNKILSNFIVVY